MGLFKKLIHNANPLTPIKNLKKGDLNGTLDPGHHVLPDDYGKAKKAQAADKAAVAAAAADFNSRSPQDWVSLLPSTVVPPGGYPGVSNVPPQGATPAQSPLAAGFGGLLQNGAINAGTENGSLMSIPTQPVPPQQQPFHAYGPYGLLAAQMAGVQTADPNQQMGLLRPIAPQGQKVPGGMPPSAIPYRPYGK